MLEGILNIHFINEDGAVYGTQYGLMMSFHYQTVVFTPFVHDSKHFTHSKHAYFTINDKVVELMESRYAYPYFVRVWTTAPTGINSASGMTINFPNKNHIINNGTKIENIKNIEYNGWHISLPPIYVQAINGNIELGTVIQYKNKISGIVVKHHNDESIIIGMYFLKQLINGLDMNYAAIYYGIKNVDDKIIVAEDWDIYPSGLKINDIILKIEDVKAGETMFMNKIDKYIYIDTWIAWMYMENSELNITVKRDNNIMNIKIPRIPLSHIMQYKYYSNIPDDITFEKLVLNSKNSRYNMIGNQLKNNPKQLFI
jgi:hypothetical protein